MTILFLFITLLLGLAAFGRAMFSDENGNAPLSHRLLSLLIIIAFALGIAFCGCGGSTMITKVEVRERPDSLIIKGDSVAFTAASDSIIIDSVAAVPVAESVGDNVLPSTARQPSIMYRSVHARKDTNVGRWKMRFEYQYPPDRWSVKIIEADTTARWMVRDSIIREPYPVSEVPFWVYVVLLLAALIVLRSFFK